MGKWGRTVAMMTMMMMIIDGESFVPFCEYTYEYFPPCLHFLTGIYHKPSRRCCAHIDKLNRIARHRKENPRLLCQCVQLITKGKQPSMLSDRIQDLPSLCNTRLSFPISSSMDCSTVQDGD
ncbi:PREDICTED: non-specific lipid-transfer protein 13 [Tarenaya hassleriana]|uniref:non-specific lipid-transfer protein 13 n=1 Tax=Tarenaya hassleriana TaxID=28532 RepID=UPI00053C9056|nr:PREDICTED: non-specific lipid-transfer protein 13 [Tarenaya hassleriana]